MVEAQKEKAFDTEERINLSKENEDIPKPPVVGEYGINEGGIQYTLDDACEHIGFGIFQIKMIIVVGLSWMSDSMEMMVLSILAPILMCEWRLSSTREALITTMVFLGQGFGSIFWGFVSDMFGRKKGLYLSVTLVLFFGILSSQAPSYVWILLLRFLVGFGIGGIPQAVTVLTEVLPMNSRGRSVVMLEFFWALGSVFAAAIAIATVDQFGWRYYLLLIASPLLFFLVFALWLPESPRYLLTTGQNEKLLKVLERIASTNGKSLPNGTLATGQLNTKRGRIFTLFSADWRRTMLLLIVIWFTSAFCYYGIVLLTTEMFQTNINGCHPVSHHNTTRSLGECKRLTQKDYTDFMLTSVAEFPGLVFALILVEWIGRRKSLALQFGLASIAFLLIGICTTRNASVVFLFIARGLITGSFQTAFVYTSEVLPTNVRAVGLGCCSMFARIGAMLTPFVAQVLIHKSLYLVIGVYTAPLLVCVVASLLFKIETAGKALQDSSASTPIDINMAGYQSFR